MLLGAAHGWPLGLASQETRTLVGQVRSADEGTAIEGVRVAVLELPRYAQTDREGRFLLRELPRHPLRLVFDRIGLVTDTLSVDADRDSVVVYLRYSAVSLAPVRGSPALEARQRFEIKAQTSTITLSPLDVSEAPVLLEPDPLRTVQLLPGTVAKSDFTVGMNVRGGETDQNLIRLDGMPVFNPFHVGGLFSTFDNSAVDRVEFLTGGFPAGYGGRLSSVLDVELRSGNSSTTDVNGLVSLLSSKLLVEGPVGGTGATYMIGGRRSYADALVSVVDPDLVPYYFADAIAKVTVPMPRGGSLSLTGYWGRDVLDVPWVDDEPGREGIDLVLDWGNQLVGVRLRQPLGSFEIDQVIGVSRFSSGIGFEPDIFGYHNTASVFTLQTSVALPRIWRNEVRVGFGFDRYSMTFDATSTAFETSVLALDYAPVVWSAFLDDQIRPVEWLLLRPGVRVEGVAGGRDETFVAPRVALKAFAADDFAITGSAGRYFQPIHSIRDQDLPVTMFDFWIGADDLTPVARAGHLVAGFERWFGAAVSLSVEGFVKSFDDLVVQNEADDPRVHGDEFVEAAGNAYGVDLLLRKYAGAITGWLAYGFVKAERESGGIEFPPTHDRRHTLDLVLQSKGPLGSRMNLHWGYGSPLPYTGIVGQWHHREYNAELNTFDRFDDEAVSTERNGERFPHYSRLDVGLAWEFEKWGARWRPYVQVINVYNRSNVWFYTFDYDRSPPTRTGMTQLPVFPSVGLEFSW